MPRPLRVLVALAVTAALAPPAAAGAAEGFVGVTARGALVAFTDQAASAWTTPRAVRGLAPVERIVAAGGDRRGTVWAVGSSARLYRFTAPRAAVPVVRAVGAPFAAGLRGTAFGLAVAPGAATALLTSDVGQVVAVDLATGAATERPELRRPTGEPVALAGAYAADGRLVGVDRRRREVVRETAPGSGVLEGGVAARPVVGLPTLEPLTFAPLDGGRALLTATVTYNRGTGRQSVVSDLDLGTGTPRRDGTPFTAQELVTFASVGPVPDDRAIAGLRVTRPPARVSVRALARDARTGGARALRMRVVAREAFTAVAVLRVGDRRIGSAAAASSFFGGTAPLGVLAARGETGRLARYAGRRATIAVSVRDDAGNRRVVRRAFRLVP